MLEKVYTFQYTKKDGNVILCYNKSAQNAIISRLESILEHGNATPIIIMPLCEICETTEEEYNFAESIKKSIGG